MAIQVLIADDHNMVVNGLKTMLADSPEIEVVATASDGEEVLAKLEEHPGVSVLLLDINMPKKTGIQVTEELVGQNQDKKVIAITMFDQEDYIVSMLQAGAKGYLLKNTGQDELITAIKKVHAGETYFSQEVASTVMARYMEGGTAGLAKAASSMGKAPAGIKQVSLTERELEILKLVASEMTNQEIADKLFISPRTVHSHRRNLMQKIGVKNTAGLVRYALQYDLL